MVRCGISSHTHIWKGFIKYMPLTEKDTTREIFCSMIKEKSKLRITFSEAGVKTK